ncbi:MAG: hypothetical protein NT099_10135, partial [Candidatus Saganbacteria bacterium]|nr:hypothetical protein [Candidatus Saganbacteria bacterium]
YRSGTNLLLGGNNPLLTAFLSPKIILEFRKKTRNKLKKRFPKTSVWPILGYNIPWDDNCFDNTVVTEFLSFLDFSLIPTILTEALRVTKKEVIVLLPSKCLKGTNQRIKTLILGFASSGLSVEIVSKDQLTIFKLTKNHQSVDYPLNFHRNPLLSSQGSQASLKQTFWFDQNHYNVCQQFYDLYLPPLSSFLKNPLFCSTFGKTYGESQKTNNYPETQMLHIYNESVPVNSLGTNLFLMSLDDKIGLLSQHDWYRLLNNLDILLIPKSKDVALLSETFKLEPERIQTLSPCLENVIPQIIGPNLKTHLKKVLIFIDDLLLAEKMERIIGILKNHAIEVTLLYSAPIKPIDQLNYFESHILIPKPFDLYPVQTKSRWYSYFATQNEIQKRLFSQNTQHLYALNQKRRKLFKKLLTGSPLKAIKYKGLESLPPDFLVQFDLVCTLGENRSQIQFLLSAMLYGSIPIIETNAFSDLFTQENSIALNNLDNLIRELKNQPETTKELSKEAVKTAQTYSLELQCRTLLKAAQTYKEALEKDPAFRLKHLERKAFTALSYLDIENTKKMLKEIEEIKPETLFFQYYRAKLTALEGNIDAAILELERLKIILEEDRTTKFMLIDLYLLLGKLYFSIGERTQAIKLWSAVQKEDPFNTESAYLLTILT